MISRVELNYQEPRCRPLFRMLEVLDKEVLKDWTCEIRCWTTHSENQLLVGNLIKLVSNWQQTIADPEREGVALLLTKTLQPMKILQPTTAGTGRKGADPFMMKT